MDKKDQCENAQLKGSDNKEIQTRMCDVFLKSRKLCDEEIKMPTYYSRSRSKMHPFRFSSLKCERTVFGTLLKCSAKIKIQIHNSLFPYFFHELIFTILLILKFESLLLHLCVFPKGAPEGLGVLSCLKVFPNVEPLSGRQHQEDDAQYLRESQFR